MKTKDILAYTNPVILVIGTGFFIAGVIYFGSKGVKQIFNE
jgi:hypothetical protein